MYEGLIAGASLLLLITGTWLVARRGRHKAPKLYKGADLTEIVRAAELANNGFFRSLELVQRNLEVLIARAEGIEQRLKGLMLHSGVEKREQYTAAAVLLAEGHDVERVSSMLGLPEAQVQLIRELQQIKGKEKRSGRGRRSDEAAIERSPQPKVAGDREKTTPPPILLVDVLKNATADETKKPNSLARITGVTA
jgi:hypothetical protein